MTNDTNQDDVKYFEVFKSLHRGGLSLWLNRKSLLPMTLLPTAVAFLTLPLMRGYAPDDMSHFMLAVAQIPSDFCIGLFCSLIILIIMHAPKKKDDGKPVMFSMNLVDKKRILIAGAVAHTLFSYLYMGGFAVMNYFAEPMQQAARDEVMRGDLMLITIALMVIGLYFIRFALLPILVVGQIDIRDFYNQYKGYGLSLPVFFVKLLPMLAVGLLLVIPLSLANNNGTTEELTTVSVLADFVGDITVAVTAVLTHAWAYASLAIGVRTMLNR